MKKASIILCVYNGEKTIEKCIRSILKQTYTKFELIIINDGSNDNTMNIIKNIQDNRIRIINQKNHGLSYSRNVGLQNVNGDYIFFVDVDDTVSNKLLEEVICKIEKNDLVVFSYKECHRFISKKRITSGKYPNKDNISEYGYVWNKAYKKSIINKYKIQFSNDIELVEDLNFNKKYLKYVKKIAFIKQPLYNYNKQNKHALSKKYYDNFLKMKEINIKDKLEIIGYDLELEKHLYLQLIKHYMISCLRNKKDINISNIYHKYEEKITSIKEKTLEEKVLLYLIENKHFFLLKSLLKIIVKIYDFT